LPPDIAGPLAELQDRSNRLRGALQNRLLKSI
jgi:hypothetical protein